jgi:hypothetical protein
MKIGIMQPYFLPYIGYFQLIDSVDIYVNLDHVSFMKRSYMTRNIIKDNVRIGVHVYSASQNKTCREIYVNFEKNYNDKFKKTLHQLYSKSPNYNIINDEIISPCFVDSDINISDFNFNLVKNISKYLLIDTKFVDTSIGLTDKKKGDGLIEITKSFNSNKYVNAIGGQSLYNKKYFLEHEVELFFIKMSEDIKNPYVSILDSLYTKPKESIIEDLKKYTLI